MRNIGQHVFDPEYALSKNLTELSRKDLCALVAEICRQVRDEVGNDSWRGGIYPENISCSPNGEIAIGPGKKRDWTEKELAYIAPEIYWNNKPCPQSDVYSLGLLLYCGASAGKLPFDGESNNSQLMRMSGKTVYAPAAAGSQLGDIIEKALRFKEADRYRNPEELAIMLDYCEDNRLLQKRSGAEAIFQKEVTDLSDLEKMMLNIIEGKTAPTAPVRREPSEDEILDEIVASVRGDTAETEKSEEEIFSEAGLKRPEPAPKQETAAYSLADYFGLDEPDPRDPAELEEEEEIRVYEPKGKKGIPILTEENDPELEPITVKTKKNVAQTGKRSSAAARNSGSAPSGARSAASEGEEGGQKRRPLLVVLLLLAVLLIAAVVANILINAFSDRGSGAPDVSVVVPSAEPTEDPTVEAILSEEQIRQQAAEQEAQQQAAQNESENQAEVQVEATPVPHTYEAIRADVGWLEAQQEAVTRGGQLVTVNTSEELQTVIQLATEAGFDKIWIGAHRVDGNIVWESGEEAVFYQWDAGEPSIYDYGDGASEDYVMLWNRNGQWVYNDSRENPLTDFYGMYGGRIGYVVEYGN